MIDSRLPPISPLNISVVLSIVCMALGGIFDKKALEQASARDVALILYLVRLINIPVSAAILYILRPEGHLSTELFLWAFCASSCVFVAIMGYTIAMSLCEASYVMGMTAGYSVVFQFLSVLWLNENLVANRLIGAAIIAVGVAVIGASAASKQAFPTGKNFVLAIASLVISMVGWGMSNVFDKKAIMIAHPFQVAFAEGLWDLLMIAGLFFFHVKVKGHRPNLTSYRTWKFCVLSTLTWLVSNYAYFYAFSLGNASYVSAICSAYPLAMYLFSLTLLRESFNRTRMAGIVFVTIGSAVVQCTQSGI